MIALVRLAGISAWRFVLAAALGVVAILAGAFLLGLSGYLICRASEQPPILSLGALTVGVRALALVRPLARYGERLSGHDLAFRCLGRLRTETYSRIEPLAPAGIEHFRSGELVGRLVSDIDELQDVVLRLLLPVAIALPTAMLLIVGVGLVDLASAGVLAFGLLVAATVPPLVAYRTTVRSDDHRADLRADLATKIVDVLAAADELWLAGADRAASDQIDAIDAKLARVATRDARAAGLADALLVAIAGLTALAVLVTASAEAGEGTIDVLLVAPLTFVALAAFEAVNPLAAAARRLPFVAAAGDRVLAVINRSPDVVDPDDPTRVPRPRPEIDLRGVRIRRGRAATTVVDDFDLDLAPGERLVVQGPSGAGKSTVLQLLVRFLERDGGDAAVDGQDLRRYSQEELRSAVLLMDQNPHVFNSDVRQNVAVARPGADDRDIFAALDRARLGSWARSLPDGLDTRVGEAGRTLSGGERQRLALARAFLADPSVLLLDEPTAHLDAEQADTLLGDLWSEAGDRSVVLVSHGHRGAFEGARVVHLERRSGTATRPTEDPR